MNNEKNSSVNQEKVFDKESLQEIANERNKELSIEREKTPEINTNEAEGARQEALEQASNSREKESKSANKSSAEKSPAERRGPASKAEREASFQTTMKEVRTQMSGSSRTFSKFIHQPTVEKISNTVGSTIARPNAILSGSVFAFLFTLGIYVLARFNGYPLTGTETIASFFLGWAVGLIADYFRLIVTGKK
ncbi:hypothetical protein EOL96_05295 [Candidatus Saccharibacteria bacterium]|nr:hypothetical protein [Candidatus Saccharibacteria bacterium]